MGKKIDAEELYHRMYEEAFEKDSDLQKWDSGCWIRFKLFENVLKDTPEIEEKTGRCKNCDKWKQGKTGNNEDWYSNEGFCSNWRVITGEDFYCADFEVKEKNKECIK